ncbi:MAG TPA: ABC transporter substrate-binding protein [Chloroflexota bacterium]|nr:ABC transporter substrate-binding protein [Chloroflexota bacterium]
MTIPSIGPRARFGLTARAACAAILCAGLAIAPQSAAAQRAAAGFTDVGTLTVAGYGSAADLDPASNELASSDMIARNIDDTLVAINGSSINDYVPSLATSWSANADKSVWTFHLRHGVRFHTGRCCMTATDVQYSLARTMQANLTNGYVLARFIANPMKQIKIIDPYTIQFDLGSPQPIFIAALTQNYAELILDSQAVKAHYKGNDWGHAWVSSHDVGTGPYMIQSWARSEQVTLVRFPQYWGGWSGPHFSKVIVESVANPETRRELAEKGPAVMTQDLTPQDYDALRKESSVKLDIHYGTEVEYLPFAESGPLASPLARQALSYAFNYDAFITAAFRSYAHRAYGPLASTLLGYDPNMFHYTTDLNKAKALLAQAGVKPGTTFTYQYSNGQPEYVIAGQIMQAQLQQIGYNLTMQGLDEAAYNTMFYGSEPASKRANIMEFGWWPDYNDPYDESVPLVASTSGGSNGANAGFYHNAQVDQLLAKMKNADHAQLISAAKAMQNITSRVDPPAIWLDEPAMVTVMSKDLQGFVFNPLDISTYEFYSMYR